MFRQGQQIGPYTLIREIGRGGFGEVWLAERRTEFATTRFAVKFPLGRQIDIEPIKSEAQLWAKASGHPNVLPIVEANSYAGQIIIVSEFASDGSLETILKHNKELSHKKVLEITIGILRGLEFLHSKNIIHRDIKPENVLMQGEIPRLTDFGISRVIKGTSASVTVAGTPKYMAPEAFDGKRTIPTDIWAVGVIIYRMLKGELPFPQEETTELLGAVIMKEPDPLPDSVPEHLRTVVNKALKKDVEERYQTAREMREDLQQDLAVISYPEAVPKEILSKPDPEETLISPVEDETVTVGGKKRARNPVQQKTSVIQTDEQPSLVTKISNVKTPKITRQPKQGKGNAFVWAGLVFLLIVIFAGFAGFNYWQSFPVVTTEKDIKSVSENGRLTMVAKDALGKDFAPRVSIRRAGENEELAYSFGGRSIELPPGSYDVFFAYKPNIEHLGVAVSQGKETILEAGGYGRLTLVAKDALGKDISPRVSIRRAAETEEIAYSFGGRSIDLPPGSYDVSFAFKPDIEHLGVAVNKGKETTVEAGGFGRLTLVAKDALGKDITPRVSIRQAGEDEEIAYSFGGKSIDLPPGTYDLVFHIADGVWKRGIVVQKGATIPVEIRSN